MSYFFNLINPFSTPFSTVKNQKNCGFSKELSSPNVQSIFVKKRHPPTLRKPCVFRLHACVYIYLDTPDFLNMRVSATTVVVFCLVVVTINILEYLFFVTYHTENQKSKKLQGNW